MFCECVFVYGTWEFIFFIKKHKKEAAIFKVAKKIIINRFMVLLFFYLFVTIYVRAVCHIYYKLKRFIYIFFSLLGASFFAMI